MKKCKINFTELCDELEELLILGKDFFVLATGEVIERLEMFFYDEYELEDEDFTGEYNYEQLYSLSTLNDEDEPCRIFIGKAKVRNTLLTNELDNGEYFILTDEVSKEEVLDRYRGGLISFYDLVDGCENKYCDDCNECEEDEIDFENDYGFDEEIDDTVIAISQVITNYCERINNACCEECRQKLFAEMFISAMRIGYEDAQQEMREFLG